VGGGVNVVLTDQNGGTFYDQTASDGSFGLSVAPGQYMLRVSGDFGAGFWYTGQLDLSSSLDQDLTLHNLYVDLDVVDSDGNPVEGAHATMPGQCQGSSFELFSGMTVNGFFGNSQGSTGADGHAKLGLFPCPGPVTYSITPPDCSGLAATSVVVPGPIENDTSIHVTLYSIYCNVEDGAGDPLGNQTVEVDPEQDVGAGAHAASGGGASTTTDASGFYGLTVPPATYRLTLKGKAPAGAALPKSYSVSVGGVDLKNGRVQNLTLPVETLAATIVGPTGAPAAGAVVKVPCTDTSFSLFPGGQATGRVCGGASADADGVAAVALLPAASANVSVTAPAGLHACPATVRGVAIEQDKLLTITLAACVAVSDGGFQPSSTPLAQGGTVRWKSAGTVDRTVTDASGMGLFDSGPLPPGSTFTLSFASAATYRVIDQPTSHRATVEVPTTATPANGSPSTEFTIRWASQKPPSGYAADVQVHRPGVKRWAFLRRGTTATSTGFTPEAGVGVYEFRARFDNTGNGHSSGWSPLASIDVQ